MLSNSSLHTDIARAKSAGADGYLVKPLSLSVLQTILEGEEPVQNLHCYVFRDGLPALQWTRGRMGVAAEDVPALRRTMGQGGAVVAEVDRELRYVWIDNPHADFDPALGVGKRERPTRTFPLFPKYSTPFLIAPFD